MNYKVFTVYDSKAEYYMQPFLFQNIGEAIRAFADTATDPSTTIGRHPGDFTLFQIGTWDNATAIFTSLDANVNLGCAIEHTSKKDQNT